MKRCTDMLQLLQTPKKTTFQPHDSQLGHTMHNGVYSQFSHGGEKAECELVCVKMHSSAVDTRFSFWVSHPFIE